MDFISRLVDRLRAAYKGLNPDSAEANYVRDMVDAAEKLQKLWTEALSEAAETSNLVEIDTDTKSASPMLSERIWRESEYGTKYSDRDASNNIRYSDRNGNIKDATGLSEEDLEYLLENAQNGVLSDSSYIPLRRNTPEFFIGVVTEHSKGTYFIEDYPIAAKVEHIRQNMEEDDGQSYGEHRPHGFSIGDIITISREMGDPAYIVLQENGRYAEVVSFYNKQNKKVIVAIDIADIRPASRKNYKYSQYMNGYNDGYYNIIVTQYEPDSLKKYLEKNEVVYDKKKMNGKYQVGSGRIVTVTHDTPFIDDIISHPDDSVNEKFSERDSSYMDAVNRGDMETAQRMVDKAARDAGYTNLFYHGAKKGGGFTEFRDWSYFTENKEYAKRYTDRNAPGSLYTTYVKLDNPFDTRKPADRKLFDSIRNEYGLSEVQDTGLPDWTDDYDIADYIDENELDYDGIILDEGGDLVDGKPVSRGLSYVIRKSAQIKSADSVTYDDNGNVIPLSERFNVENNDIRYSDRDFSYNTLVSKPDMKLTMVGTIYQIIVLIL